MGCQTPYRVKNRELTAFWSSSANKPQATKTRTKTTQVEILLTNEIASFSATVTINLLKGQSRSEAVGGILAVTKREKIQRKSPGSTRPVQIVKIKLSSH